MKGRAALVTGAGQGIGKAIARTLAARGVAVAILDRDGPGAEHAAAEIEDEGGRAIALRADVSRIGELREAIDACAARLGSIDILVNNAGILHATPIEAIGEEEWDSILAVNLKGAFFAAQAAIPHMRARGWGRIVSVSSLAGRMGGYANGVAYSASKAGLIGLTRALARRLAADGITVNAVAPGTTETDIVKGLPEERLAELKETIPMKRFGRPVEIAEAVSFLCGEDSAYITGAVLDVNGGIYSG